MFSGLRILALLWLAGMMTSAAHAAYKCVTPEGNTEYIDLPKEGYTCTEIRGISRPQPQPDAATEEAPEVEQAPEETETAESEQEVDPRQANCEQARANMDILQSEQSVVIKDAEGNQVLLDAEGREQEMAKAQKDIDYWCDSE